MRMSERVKQIIELNLVNYYIPLVVGNGHVFPMYYGRIMEENLIAFPVTNATGIADVLKETSPAYAMVADREGGYEAYLLRGKARYVTQELDYDLISIMQNVVPGFPIHGAVIMEVEGEHLTPPP